MQETEKRNHRIEEKIEKTKSETENQNQNKSLNNFNSEYLKQRVSEYVDLKYRIEKIDLKIKNLREKLDKI